MQKYKLLALLAALIAGIVYWLSQTMLVPQPVQVAVVDLPTRTLYVATTGNDSGDGSLTSPFRTVGKALITATPGTIIRVKPGTYQENIRLKDKHGTNNTPIRVVGDSSDPSQYPIIDGGDPDYKTYGNPAFTLTNSSWLTFEKLKIINSSEASYYLENSHYIVIRRNNIIYNHFGIQLKGNTSHVLAEYNDISQKLPPNPTWTSIKSSKWEGGAFYTSAAGMHIVRYNYIHNMMNGVLLMRSSSFDKQAASANVWIYDNRFENIIDDPYEPEVYAFNQHFFRNTLINTHRLVSLVNDNLTGPVYVYNNMQLVTNDPTGGEAATGRINSAVKLDLSGRNVNGAYFFNNTASLLPSITNGYGIDFLNSTAVNFTHVNQIYQTYKNAIGKTPNLQSGSLIDYDLSNTQGYAEPNGLLNTQAGFVNPSQEDLRLTSDSPARAKGKEVTAELGFSQKLIIPAGSDLGAFPYGSTDFRTTPSPVYLTPPGGEDPSFPSNQPWPTDLEGGYNPPSSPKWLKAGTSTPVVLPSPLVNPSPARISPNPTPVLQASPSPARISPTPTPVNTQTQLMQISSPYQGQLVKRGDKIKISAHSLSGLPLYKFNLLVDGRLINTCFRVSYCSTTYDTSKLKTGTHIVKVKAANKKSYWSWDQIQTVSIQIY